MTTEAAVIVSSGTI